MTDPKPALAATQNRLRLMGWIVSKDGVKHWHFVKPDTRDVATDRKVTDRVAELVRAGLAEIPPADAFNTSMVRLTPAGVEYLNTYGKNGATS